MGFLRTANRLNPDAVNDLTELGNLLFEKKEFDKAKETFMLVLKSKNKNKMAEAHEKIGLILKEQGDVKGAIEEFNKALEIEPDNEEIKNYLEQIKM